jgi:hypothetical protein
MNKILNAIISFFETMAQARAATVLARQGLYEEAKKVCK